MIHPRDIVSRFFDRHLRRSAGGGDYFYSSQRFDEFKSLARQADRYGEVRKAAIRRFDEIGKGYEARVYDIHSDAVLKISDDPKNLRAEYVIFKDSRFIEVTPTVYEHGENWRWMTVEKVDADAVSSWLDVMRYFPSIRDASRQDRPSVGDEDWGADPISIFVHTLDNHLNWALEGTFEGNALTYLTDEEEEWITSVAEIYRTLGLDHFDIKPENLAEDGRDRLVLIDVFVANV